MAPELTDKIGFYSGNKKLDTSHLEEPENDTEEVRERWLGGKKEIKFQRKLKRWKDKISKTLKFEDLTIHMVGESHIDVAWMWPFIQTRKKAQRTFQKAILHSHMFPETFHFALSEPILLEWIKQDNPELFRNIQETVKKGNIELVGGSYVEPDCQMPSGEAIIRQRLYGMRFFKDNFGILPKVEWFLDSFGYNHGLPQILIKSGAKYFWTTKITWNRITTFPFVHFWWQGPDGTRILTANFNMGDNSLESWDKYEVGRHLLKEGGKKAWNYTDDYSEYENHIDRNLACPHAGYFFGEGDGGHGPTHKEVAMANKLAELPTFKWSTVETFFTSIEKYADKFPIWQDEMYLETHRGCFSNHAVVKRQNRKFENLIGSLEILALIAALENETCEYPMPQLEKLWKITLKNQFHDTLPGSSIPEVYDEVWEDWMEQDNIISKIKKNISSALTFQEKDAKNNDMAHVFLFNSLSWKRKARIFIPITIFNVLPELDSEGKPPYAKIETCNSEKKIEICQPISKESDDLIGNRPAGWWTILDLNPLAYVIAKVTLLEGEQANELTSNSKLNVTQDAISNNLIQLKINPKNGAMNEITSNGINQNRNLIKGDSSNLSLGFLDDVQVGFHAWNIKDEYWQYPIPLSNEQDVNIKISEQGPIFNTIMISKTLGVSPVSQTITLFKEKPEIFFEYMADWKQKDIMLKILYSTATNAEHVHADSMFCALQSKTNPEVPCDKARYEKICHKYFDLSTPDNSWGIALLNEGKYAFDVNGGDFRLTLLRACRYPVTAPEAWSNIEREMNMKKFNHQVPEYSGLGPFRCRYALLPHEAGTLKFADGRPNVVVKRSAEEFNNPVMVIPVQNTTKTQNNTSFLNKSLLEILNENVMLSALKFKEWNNNNSLIARFYEVSGIPTNVKVKLNSSLFKQIERIISVDLIEREEDNKFEWDEEIGMLSFYVNKFEIRTFEFKLA